MQNRKIVVLTPVRNEEWCLEGFFATTSLWADAIIISDQSADDSTRRLAEGYLKVQILKNNSNQFNERENRIRLLTEARRLYPGSIFFSLDADERLSANILDADLRQKIDILEPGTAISIPFANLRGTREYWEVPLDPIAFVDDGREPDVDKSIHFPRSCFATFARTVDLGLRTLHLQYLDLDRFYSKLIWYQLLEVTRLREESPLRLFRRYRHFDAVQKKHLRELPREWIEGYEIRGVDALSVKLGETPWWLAETNLMSNSLYGYSKLLFRRLTDRGAVKEVRLKRRDEIIVRYLWATSKLYLPKKTSITFIALVLIDKLAELLVSKFRLPI